MEAKKVAYINLLHKTSYARAEAYLNKLKTGEQTAGLLLQKILNTRQIELLKVT